MQPQVRPETNYRLNQELREFLAIDEYYFKRETAVKRIRLTIAGIARIHLKIPGRIKVFGSFSNGFKTGGSDLDIMFINSESGESAVSLLQEFSHYISISGFENITHIFSAKIPILKFTDFKSKIEVDFCINNVLGARNSLLLNAYCVYDQRVLQLGRLVKHWAKHHELTGSADGYLNSYAYMLLVVFYLQQRPVPVVPNLQMLASKPVIVVDRKWGDEDAWDTKFVEDVQSLPPSENTQNVGELLLGFFHFFGHVFSWRCHAACIRLNQPGVAIEKSSLLQQTQEDQWYIEDPFDLKHNLAGKCTRVCRSRVIDEMRRSLAILTTSGSWQRIFPPRPPECFFLKCRISNYVTPQALLELFDEFDLVKLHISQPEGSSRFGTAFLEFDAAMNRRRAHTKNEVYIGDCQLQLHHSSQAFFAEAVKDSFSTYDSASYRMKKKVIMARQGASFPVERPGVALTPVRQPGYQGSSHEAGLGYVLVPVGPSGYGGMPSFSSAGASASYPQGGLHIVGTNSFGRPFTSSQTAFFGEEQQARRNDDEMEGSQMPQAKVTKKTKEKKSEKAGHMEPTTGKGKQTTHPAITICPIEVSIAKGNSKDQKNVTALRGSVEKHDMTACMPSESDAKMLSKQSDIVAPKSSNGCWVNLHLHNDLPAGTSVFTGEQAQQIALLRKKFKGLSLSSARHTDEVIVTLDLKKQSEPVFSQAQMHDIKRIQEWLKSFQR